MVIKWILRNAFQLLLIGGFIFICIAVVRCQKFVKENKRLTKNIEAAHDTLHHFETKAGDSAISHKIETLRPAEVKKLQPIVYREIKNLGQKSRDVTHAGVTGIESHLSTTIPIHDTTVDTVKYSGINWTNGWYTIHGYSKNDTAHLNVSSRDTIVILAYEKSRFKILGFRFGTRVLYTSATTKNPSSNIFFDTQIKIEKR